MSSPASVAGALSPPGASLDPGPSWCRLPRAGRAARDRRWRHGPAQVAGPQLCSLPTRSLSWAGCKVRSNWCWCCRREVLRLPVADQPLAGQRAHSVVPALGWNQCHGYVPTWPCTFVSEMSPQRLFFFCICCSEGVGHPSSLFQNFSLDFCV